ncbi:MAG: hypothetical protein QXQ77_00305 [Candidatus Aenigmatarchaeota archaeon]
MGVKEFFKPTWKKIIIFAVIFTFTSITGILYESVSLQKGSIVLVGSPLPYLVSCNKAKTVCPELSVAFNILALLGDVILWYIAACAVCLLLR